MKKIENKSEFMCWANRVNTHQPNLCDLQDEYAHTGCGLLFNWFTEMNHSERELTLFAVQKAMGSSCLFDFITLIVNYKVTERLSAAEDEIAERHLVLSREYRKIEKLKEELVKMQLTIDTLIK